MTAPKCSQEEFVAAWRRLGSQKAVAKFFGMSIPTVKERRERLEKNGIFLDTASPGAVGPIPASLPRQGIRALADITGTVLIGSDCHYWPGDASTAHKAFVTLCKELKPSMVILNGDLMDNARLCRQDPIGWDKSSAPSVKEELEALQERTHEIVLAAGRRCQRVRTIGNHDIRLERYLAMNASEVEGLPGTTLDYFLPEWEAAWSLMINTHTMVKHRLNNGVHAAYNNTLRAGLSIFTGHLHRLLITPFGDYRGRRWGVDTGTMADMGPEAPQFQYMEDAPVVGCSGFAAATFDKNGMLLPPELCEVINGTAYFRGKPV